MANEQFKKANDLINRVLDVPSMYTLNLPKITLLGNIQLYIENHQGISWYQTDLIKVACLGGLIIIHGQDLVLRYIEKEELYIDGHIMSVEYQLQEAH